MKESNMLFYKGYLINPRQFRVPGYNISPFSTEWISRNIKLLQSGIPIDKDLLEFYFGNHFFCDSGKTAISQILKQYNLNREDEVYIVTTTGNKYISCCVTEEIEKLCRWSRKPGPDTRLIYVNHEFGFVHKQMDELVKMGIPIIEDMATSMLSTDTNQCTGSYGDFTIYSLPKYIPVQFGGIIKVNNIDAVTVPLPDQDSSMTDCLGKLASWYLKNAENITLKRLYNHHLFSEKLAPLGFTDRFILQQGETPAVYMFSASADFDLPGLKEFLQRNGIECSVFYGENAFFIPVHQNLKEADINFIALLIEYYCNEQHDSDRMRPEAAGQLNNHSFF